MNESTNAPPPEKKWKVTTNRYVAYIDIMGFKDMVSRISHDEIYKIMKKIDESRKYSENHILNKRKYSLVKSTTYSDSIMIYSKDGNNDSLDSFIFTVSRFTNSLFTEGIPHKGAVAFGRMTLDFKNSIFFGQPLIDAYLLQEELHFYGIIVHGTAEIEINNTWRNASDEIFLMKYPCPLKNGKSTHFTIEPQWASESDAPTLKCKTTELFQSIIKLRYKTSGYLRQYVDNTEVYLNYVREHNKKIKT